jgi:lipoyl(octanoyl) transferase
MNKILNFYNIGRIDYEEAWELQKELLALRYQKKIPDTLLFVEHPNTYTLGKIAKQENLISSEAVLKEKNIKVFEIDRGGDITYHGPGQIVGYPIIDLNEWKNDTHEYLRALEEIIIKTCEHYNLKAGRNPKFTGVWIEDRKIAAIGIKISHWITMHGFAFNINTDLTYFTGIIPCGIKDKDVTSLKKELNQKINMEEVKNILLDNFKVKFNYNKINILPKEELATLALT